MSEESERADAEARLRDEAEGTLEAYLAQAAAIEKNLKNSKLFSDLQARITKEKTKETLDAVKTLKMALEEKKITEAQYLIQRKQVVENKKQTQAMKEQYAALTQIREENEKIKRQSRDRIDKLRQEGKEIRANAAEFAQRFKDPNTGKVSAGQSVKAGTDIAQDPAQMLNAMGVWGIIIKFIVDIIDGVRKMRGEFTKASAAAGGFGNALARANKDALLLSSSQAEFTKNYGLSSDQVSELYINLKNTGLEALGAVSGVGGQLSEIAHNTQTFALAAGESIDVVANRQASFVRNFGIATGDLGKQYAKVFGTAQTLAKAGIATTSKLMQTIQGLAESFTDVGVSIDSVRGIVSGVGKALKSLGAPLALLDKVSQGIMGISKASEGWQVFMAKMSGVQGGYGTALFAAQQRQGLMLPGSGDFNAQRMIQMAGGALNKATAGVGDPRMKQILTERFGQKLGMDPRTTQVFQQLSSGAISQEDAAANLEELHEEAMEANLDAKGMFDILRDVLMGLIAKPIIAIYGFIQKWSGKANAADQKLLDAMNQKSGMATGESGGSGPIMTSEAKAALGADTARSTAKLVRSAGFVRVHGNEVIAGRRAYPFAETSPLGQSGGGGGRNGLNISVNVNGIDRQTISQGMDEAKQVAINAVLEQQRRNFST